MAIIFCKSGSGVLALSNRTWSTGERMVPTTTDASSNVAVGRAWVWECTTGGTSTGTPTWPASATQDTTTVTQNGVVWTARKPGYSSGTTADWTFATIYLWYAALAAAAGDTIYVSSSHAENASFSGVLPFAGTPASPNLILCVSDASTTPTATTTGATCTTSSIGWEFRGSFYMSGISFTAPNGYNINCNSQNSASNEQVFNKCIFNLGASSGLILLGASSNYGGKRVKWQYCDVKFGAAGEYFRNYGVRFEWLGGSWLSGGTSPTNVFDFADSTNPEGITIVSGVDFSNLGAGANLVTGGAKVRAPVITFRNCKMPTSWSGGLVSTAFTNPGPRAEMFNVDASGADTNYRIATAEHVGTVTTDSGVYNDAGATDGTTSISWKMVSSSAAEYPGIALRSPEIVKWNETTGSAITVTVEIVHSSQGSGANGVLNDDEIWLEVQYLGAAGNSNALFLTDIKGATTSDQFGDVLATAAAQASSSATWTGDSAGWDAQKLSVTFTPEEKGYIVATVCLGKASATIYIDPLLTVT